MTDVVTWTIEDPSVPGEVEVHTLLPPGGAADDLPMVLWLHGAASSADSLDRHASLFEDRWADGSMPPVVATCASTPTQGGFYTDRPDGARWEHLVADVLRAATVERFGCDDGRVLVAGTSMGGYGALKLLCRDPGRYVGAVAVSPAVFAGDTPDEVPEASRPAVLGELFSLLVGRPGESVSTRLREGGDELRRVAPPLFLGVGDSDDFGLQDGAEHLHRLLLDEGVHHHYVRWLGGTHMGPEAEPLTRAAFDFAATVLSRGATSSG